MEHGKANEYIADKMKLRDRLFAVIYIITTIIFSDFLVQGPPEEWDTFKRTMRWLSRKYSEAQMIATIRDEDNTYRHRTKRAYTVNALPQRSCKGNSSTLMRQTLHCSCCNKDGHTTSKCWNKPPNYSPKCKEQGRTLRDCSGKGNQKANSGGNTSKGKAPNRSKRERRKRK